MERREDGEEEGEWGGGGTGGWGGRGRMRRRRVEEKDGEEQEGEKELERRRGRDYPVLEQGLSMLFLKAFRKSGFLLAEESLSYLHRKGQSCSMTQGARYNQNENIFRRQEVSPPACPCLYSRRSRLVSPPRPEEMALVVPLMRPFLLSLSVLAGFAGVVPK